MRAAADANRPMLILQGDQDYQVTVEHDLPGWRRLGQDVRIYPGLDHMFFPADGSHMDPAVVRDIADWVSSPAAG